MSKGWFKDQYRHALASHGISTKAKGVRDIREMGENVPPPKELYNINWNDRDDIGKAIQLFWWCSERNAWDWFDFDKAFELVKGVIREKLGEHNRLPKEEQEDFWYESIEMGEYYFASLIDNHLSRWASRDTIETIYENINERYREHEERNYGKENVFDLKDVIGEEWYNMDTIMGEFLQSPFLTELLIEEFTEHFDAFEDSTYDRISKVYKDINNSSNINNKITLFDEVVDMYHHNGGIFENYVDVPELRERYEERYSK